MQGICQGFIRSKFVPCVDHDDLRQVLVTWLAPPGISGAGHLLPLACSFVSVGGCILPPGGRFISGSVLIWGVGCQNTEECGTGGICRVQANLVDYLCSFFDEVEFLFGGCNMALMV